MLELEGDAALLPTTAHRLPAVVATVEGQRAWTGEARRGGDSGCPHLLASAAVPADLPPGDYLLTLSAKGETVHRYFFRVTGR